MLYAVLNKSWKQYTTKKKNFIEIFSTYHQSFKSGKDMLVTAIKAKRISEWAPVDAKPWEFSCSMIQNDTTFLWCQVINRKPQKCQGRQLDNFTE